MTELIVKYPDRAPDHFPLGRLRITIGRSARNDLCIPDPFASRVHAEVRREGDEYILQDLGSANGTLYNGDDLETTTAGRVKDGTVTLEWEHYLTNIVASQKGSELVGRVEMRNDRDAEGSPFRAVRHVGIVAAVLYDCASCG